MDPKTQFPPFLDFFAGSGLVCEALRGYFTPVWANDICKRKAAVFCANHPKNILNISPVQNVRGHELPEAILSWGSFPCQDLSLAGSMKGIRSHRSGLVWQWLRVMDEMEHKPPIAVAENVVGLISMEKGSNYRELHEALIDRGYRVGAVVIDAAYWVPQSRKRVFVIAVNKSIVTTKFESQMPKWCHPLSLQRAIVGLSDWIWWSLPEPIQVRKPLEAIVDLEAPCDNEQKKNRLLKLIPEKHKQKIKDAQEEGHFVFPGYKRIRNEKQVLELRFDGVAGCLRTPEGGSSRQVLIICDNGSMRTRLLTVGEAAALMGLRRSYKIPGSYNDAYRAMGDAVAVPVVRYLANYLLAPLAYNAMGRRNESRKAVR